MTVARKNERGQAIVLMVLSLVVLIGMAALAIDVGSWYRTKRRLQGTADAAALAGAQQLPKSPGAARTMAMDYADKNGGDVSASDIQIAATFNDNDTIRVKAKRTDAGVFSGVLGITSSDIDASAAARVDTPQSVRWVAPMVVSCDHDLIKNCNDNHRMPDLYTDTDLNFSKMGAPGAFGMLNLNKDQGTPGASDEAGWILHGYDGTFDVNKEYRSDPGAKFSSSDLQSALDDRIAGGIPLLFPVFEKDKSLVDGGGQVTSYYVIGWIAFHIESYEIHGNDAVLHGYFTDYIANGILSSSGSGSPDFGVKSIQLIE
jgi:Putative Flp pilus-assembly TadE/G-like